MTGLVRADLIYSDLRTRAGGRFEARGPEGWHIAQPGDAINFGRGVMVEINGADQIAGGSWFGGAFALLAGFAALGIAAVFEFGKGTGL